MTREFQNTVYLFLLEITSWTAFTQLRKQVTGFFRVCLSVRKEQLGFFWTDFLDIFLFRMRKYILWAYLNFG
jgi:hypothetical protein